MEIRFKPIGTIKTEFKATAGVPIQSCFGKERRGTIELFPEYVEGLKDLDAVSHVYLLYHFNQHNDYKLVVKPYMDETPRGLFATRAPKRPNGIGPYLGEIDCIAGAKCGWYDKVAKKITVSDNRF
jgi:tRNA-Thr(GGU) m(6)t(6)A37 methyltransferase TsaA